MDDSQSDSTNDNGGKMCAYRIEADPLHASGGGIRLSPWTIRGGGGVNSLNTHGSGLYLTPHRGKHSRGGHGLMLRLHNRHDLTRHCAGFTKKQYNTISNLV